MLGFDGSFERQIEIQQMIRMQSKEIKILFICKTGGCVSVNQSDARIFLFDIEVWFEGVLWFVAQVISVQVSVIGIFNNLRTIEIVKCLQKNI